MHLVLNLEMMEYALNCNNSIAQKNVRTLLKQGENESNSFCLGKKWLLNLITILLLILFRHKWDINFS